MQTSKHPSKHPFVRSFVHASKSNCNRDSIIPQYHHVQNKEEGCGYQNWTQSSVSSTANSTGHHHHHHHNSNPVCKKKTAEPKTITRKRGSTETTITVYDGKKLPRKTLRKLPPRHSRVKITVKGKAVANCFSVPDPKKPGVLQKRQMRAYAVEPGVDAGPMDKFTSKLPVVSHKTSPAKKQPRVHTPPTAATTTTTTTTTTTPTTPPPCMPVARPLPVKKTPPKSPPKRASATRNNKATPKKGSSRNAKKPTNAPNRELKRMAIVEVFRAVDYDKAMEEAAAMAEKQELEGKEAQLRLAMEQKAKARADDNLRKAVTRSDPVAWAAEKETAKLKMRELRLERKAQREKGLFDPSTIKPRERRCKPCKDSQLPFVQEFQVTNLGVVLPIINSPAFFESIQWYRRFIATDTEEEDNAKFAEHCSLLEGKIDTKHKDLRTLHPVDPAPGMEPGSEKCKEMIASIVLGREFLDLCIKKGLEPPRIDWVKHCRSEFQIAGTAVFSQGTE